jgi:hypothetical protein
MVRTILAIIILFCAALFLPFWLQVTLYVVAIIFVRHRVFLLLPALLSDAWYAPVRNFNIASNKTFLLVAGMILVYLLIIRTTRISERYGLEKK